MERQSGEDRERAGSRSDMDELGTDESEFASIEDVGDAPSENPAVDDV